MFSPSCTWGTEVVHSGIICDITCLSERNHKSGANQDPPRRFSALPAKGLLFFFPQNNSRSHLFLFFFVISAFLIFYRYISLPFNCTLQRCFFSLQPPHVSCIPVVPGFPFWKVVPVPPSCCSAYRFAVARISVCLAQQLPGHIGIAFFTKHIIDLIAVLACITAFFLISCTVKISFFLGDLHRN